MDVVVFLGRNLALNLVRERNVDLAAPDRHGRSIDSEFVIAYITFQ